MSVDASTLLATGNRDVAPGPEAAAAAARAGAGKDRKDEKAEPSVVDIIREKGFMAYVEELHAEKLRELREKILEAMGLSEEEFQAMPAEQRNLVEDIVAREMARRLGALSLETDSGPGKDGTHGNAGSLAGNRLTAGNVALGGPDVLQVLAAAQQSGAARPPEDDPTG